MRIRTGTRQRGFALVTSLIALVLVSAIIALLAFMSVSDLRQARATVVQMQARAIAEAGETYGRYAMSVAAQPTIRSELRGLMTVNANPETQWVINSTRWTDASNRIQAALNASFQTVAAANLNGIGSAQVAYEFKNFRGGTRSRSSQTYLVDYLVVSTGTAADGVRRVEDLGVLEIQLGKPSLSQYLFLVDNAQGNNGFFPTGTVFNGPVHANGNWGFWGKPVFMDTVTTAADGAYFWNAGGTCSGGNPTYVRGDSRPPCTVPDFRKGFTRSAPSVDLPTSAMSQQRAALGLDPEVTSSPSNAQICTALGPGVCNAGNVLPNGVYLPNSGGVITGGIYIQGGVSELLLDGSSRDGRQVYRVRQGTRTWTIELNYLTNQTRVTTTPGGLTTVYTGLPNGTTPVGSGGPTGQIYVTGQIDSLIGPGRTGAVASNAPDHPVPSQIRPALALETELNITAVNAIRLRSDLVYECDPAALGSSAYLAANPRCNVGAGNNVDTVLGVMSLNENVEITTSTPNELFLWGSYLAGRSNRGLTVENYNTRAAQGKLRLFGGLIQSVDQFRGTINNNGSLRTGYIETYDYDLRFANGAVAPPNFPTVRTFDVQTLIPVALGFREY